MAFFFEFISAFSFFKIDTLGGIPIASEYMLSLCVLRNLKTHFFFGLGYANARKNVLRRAQTGVKEDKGWRQDKIER